MILLLTLLLSGGALFSATAFHYEAIAFLDRRLSSKDGPLRRLVPVTVVVMIIAHLFEIALYGAIFALAAGPLRLGHFDGAAKMGATEFFYFAAEAYSSFGYGDIIPTGGLRVIASVAPLNGLLLLAWSGSFLYAAVHQRRVK